MAAGAAVVTDAAAGTALAALGFVDGEHYITVGPTLEDLHAKLAYWLRRYDYY